jgi:hypothetical protein
MVADGMLTRKRYREVPPRVDYELTDRARELLPVLGELARWGYRWAWGSPRSKELVDIGAIFRLAPGLIERSGGTGTVELRVDDRDGASTTYALTIERHEVTVEERAVDAPDARVSGGRSGWVQAFSPERDRSGLAISGDRALAEGLLDQLSGRAADSSRAASRAA